MRAPMSGSPLQLMIIIILIMIITLPDLTAAAACLAGRVQLGSLHQPGGCSPAAAHKHARLHWSPRKRANCMGRALVGPTTTDEAAHFRRPISAEGALVTGPLLAL